MEDEELRLQTLRFQTLRAFRRITEDGMEILKLMRKISELKQELQEARAAHSWKLKAAECKENAIKFQLLEAREELEVVEEAFFQACEDYCPDDARGECNTVHHKRMGILDKDEDWYNDLWAACATYYTSDETCGALVKEFIQFWEARVREPDFDASYCGEDEEGNVKYTIKGDHEELNRVLEEFGPKVYEAVCNAHLQVKKYVKDTVLWHYGENRKATMVDVLENWNIGICRRCDVFRG